MLTSDRVKPPNFQRARRAETHYAIQLRKVARHVGDIIRGFPAGDPNSVGPLQAILNRYAVILGPWATSTASRMLSEVAIRDEQTWAEVAATMSRALRAEIRSTPIGQAMRDFLKRQVGLITSLPTQAGERVHKLTIEGMIDATRASEIAKEIGRSGHVTAARATLIARTEVARTASSLTMVRAQHIGSEAYIWRTAEDSDVRPSHRMMAGKIVMWGAPPTLDGMVGHAGMFPNCRCYPEPIIPDVIS